MEQDETEQETTEQQDETSIPVPNQPVDQKVVDSHPSIDPSGRALYLSILQDKNREIENLRSQVAEKSKPVEKPVTQEQETKFFEQPITHTRELIRNELAQQLQPLHQFIQGFQRNSAYDNLKRNMKAQNPVLGNLLTPDIESFVDQYMQGADPTDANLTAAILQVKGAQAAGLLGTPTPTVPQPYNNPPVPQQPPNGNPVNMNIPAHLRPSAPSAPRETTSAPKRALDENERRLMREWGMTEDEYRNGQDLKEGGIGEAKSALVMEPDTKPKKKEK